MLILKIKQIKKINVKVKSSQLKMVVVVVVLLFLTITSQKSVLWHNYHDACIILLYLPALPWLG